MNDTTSTAGSSLAPDTDLHKNDLGKHLDTLVNIRAYANAVIKANITPVTEPAPDWFGPLKANLTLAQTHCGKWKDIEASMVSTVPQMLIDYGTQFANSVDAIIKIIDALPPGQGPGTGDLATITDLLGQMRDQLVDNKTSITALHSNFTTFDDNAGSDYKNLSSGAGDIAKAISADEKAESAIQGVIDQLKLDIAADTVAIDASAIAGAVGLMAGASMMALGAATMGVGFFVGVFVLAGSIASLGVMGHYLKLLHDANEKLSEKQAEYTAEVAQVTALKLLKDHITALDDLNTAMGDSLNAVKDWWTTVETKLATVITDIQKAHTDEDKDRWVALGVEMKASKEAWNQLITFATNMQNMASGITDKIVGDDKKAA
jgi:hypothetical protein